MNRKKRLLTGILCMALCLTAGTAWAAQGQGTVSENNGQTDIMAGVVVDYMGKLRFEVYKEGTTTPIEEASVELYIPSRDRYILLGLTNSNGALELDVSYNPSADLAAQFLNADGTLAFQGTLLYLNSNEIQYQVYKSGWLPYPYQGTEVLIINQDTQVITVYLYKKSTGGGGGSTSSGGSSSGNSGGSSRDDLFDPNDGEVPLPDLNEGEKTGGIPKTGVEGAVPYWFASAVFFLVAGGIFGFLWKKEQDIKKRERRYWGEKNT